MSSALKFVVILYAVINLAKCSPLQTEIDSAGDWEIFECVIQDEIGSQNYGCDDKEIHFKDYKETNEDNCVPTVDSLHIEDTTGIGLVTFRVETKSCERNRHTSRGVVLKLEISGPYATDYKVFRLRTTSRLHTKGDTTMYSLKVVLPDKSGLFIVQVAPIQTQKDNNTFASPYSVGRFDKRNIYYENIKPPVVHDICQCGDIVDVMNDTIVLSGCSSPYLVSSTVTLQGTDTIHNSSSVNTCEHVYTDLVSGDYTVLSHQKCRNGKHLKCSEDVTIPEGEVYVNKAVKSLDIKRILVIAGFATGGVTSLIFVVLFGRLIHLYHRDVKRLREKERRRTEQSDIMLVYTSDAGPKEMISEFADLLWKSTGKHVHFADDATSQGQRFSNKFDWLDVCVRKSSNFVFIASKEMLELLEWKCDGKTSSMPTGIYAESEKTWLAGIFCHLMDLLRAKLFYKRKRSQCFIISLTEDGIGGQHDYANQMAHMSLFQNKGTKIYSVSQKKPRSVPVKFIQALKGHKVERTTVPDEDVEAGDTENLLPQVPSNETISDVM
ncbi:uncharacterized protein [Argopecten irradians]|uniref:uncharacterized protein n=1 Tax=Argopecten irradians TaxID=31199 RepID=UPI0037111BB9